MINVLSASELAMRVEAQGRSYQTNIHSPAGMDLVLRLRGQDSVSGKVFNTLHWDLLLMAVSQIEHTCKPYDTYLPPINSHRTQDRSPNCLDEVQNWMQLHRPDIIDDR